MAEGLLRHDGGARFEVYSAGTHPSQVRPEAIAAMRFIDNRGAATEAYPYNPNGSPQGLTSVTTPDGRFTVMMPHAERVFRSVLHSWHPDGWGEDSPWMRMFRNARKFVG